MLNRRALAVAIAALACAGNAAGADHKGEIELLSWSLGATSSPAAAGDLAAPTPVKPAIAINTPLRTLPNRSPVVDGSRGTLMMGEKSPRHAPAVRR